LNICGSQSKVIESFVLLSIDYSNYLHLNASIHLCTSNSSIRFGLVGCFTIIFKSDYVFWDSNFLRVELIDVFWEPFCQTTDTLVLCLIIFDSLRVVLLLRRVIDLGSQPIMPHSSNFYEETGLLDVISNLIVPFLTITTISLVYP